MNATDLQALRRLLFYNVPEAAAMISGTSERAWKHWEAGARPVPDDVATALRDLADWREAVIDAALAAIDDGERAAEAGGANADQIGAARLRFVYYTRAVDWSGEPSQWRPHQSACAALVALDDRVALVPFDGPEYARWLANRKDTETMRGRWAAETTWRAV